MLSIGIDAVECDRFAHWAKFRKKSLLRLFTEQEIIYCLSVPSKSAERFAVRFAAKEAFYKAVSRVITAPLHFLSVAKYCEIVRSSSVPQLHINWQNLGSTPLQTQLSLTHTKTTAIAIVVLL